MKQKKLVEVNRFDNFNNDSAGIVVEKFYNYYPSNKLKNSSGIDVALFPKNKTNLSTKELNIAKAGIESIEGIAYFKQYFSRDNITTHRLLVYGSDKKVYINQMIDDTYDLFWLYNLTFDSVPIVLTYKKDNEDAAILTSENKMVIWETSFSPYTIEDVPIITSMCMNDGILFCTIKDPAFKIWYATDLNVENIGNISNTSGYISLEDDLGYARKVLTFNEDVYVFRDYGISKISHIKNESSVSQVYLSNTKIYCNTVSICGNNILFMTKEGLYSFNGVKVVKTKVKFNGLSFENDNAVVSSLGEKYYLALKINYNDNHSILKEEESINNSLIIYNTNDLSYEVIRGVDIKSLLPLKTEIFEKMLVIFNNDYKNKIGEVIKNSKFIDNILPKYWASGSLVKNMKTKLFTKLYINANSGVKIVLNYDNKKMHLTTYKEGVNEFVFKLCCKDIKIDISSENENGEVNSFALDYYEY